MADSDVKVTFGADTAAAVQGLAQISAALAGIAPQVASLASALAALGGKFAGLASGASGLASGLKAAGEQGAKGVSAIAAASEAALRQLQANVAEQKKTAAEQGAVEKAQNQVALAALKDRLDLGEVSSQQYFQQLEALQTQAAQYEIGQLQATLEQARATYEAKMQLSSLSIDQRNAALRQLIDAEGAASLQIQKVWTDLFKQIDQDQISQLKQFQQQWNSFVNPMVHSFTSGLVEMATGTKSFAQVMRQMGQQILNDFVGRVIDPMLEKWLWKEAGQTVATLTGNAQRSAANMASLNAGMGPAIAQALMSVKLDAGKTFAGIFAALSQNPVTMPAAPAVAAAGMAAVLAVPLAAGGFDVPAGQTPLTLLHGQEMVLPARLANPMRDMLASFGSGGAPTAGGHTFSFGDTHIHGAPNMSPADFKQALAQHRVNVAEAVASALHGGWRPSYRQPVGAL